MTPYHSELDSDEVPEESDDDSDDEDRSSAKEKNIKEAKKVHYAELAKKANIPMEDQAASAPVWEKFKKAFRSQKVSSTVNQSNRKKPTKNTVQ